MLISFENLVSQVLAQLGHDQLEHQTFCLLLSPPHPHPGYPLLLCRRPRHLPPHSHLRSLLQQLSNQEIVADGVLGRLHHHYRLLRFPHHHLLLHLHLLPHCHRLRHRLQYQLLQSQRCFYG